MASEEDIKKEHQMKQFEDAVRDKAWEYVLAVVHDNEKQNAFYDQIYEIAQLAKKVMAEPEELKEAE